MKKKLLVVVDMQNDFVSGSLGTKEAQSIVDNVYNKIVQYCSEGQSIVFTKDTHRENYLQTQEGKNLPIEHCIKGTWGWEIVDEIKDFAGNDRKECFGFETDAVYQKETFGSYELADDLCITDERFEEIEFVGLCTDICVISNVLGAKANVDKNTLISVDASCCAGVTPEAHDHAIAVMKSCQVKIYNEGKEPWRN